MATLQELKQTLAAMGLSDEAVNAAVSGIAKNDSSIKESFNAERAAERAERQARLEAESVQEREAVEEYASKLAGKLKPFEGLKLTHRIQILLGPDAEMKVTVAHGKAQVPKGEGGTREYREPKADDGVWKAVAKRVYDYRLSLGLTLMSDGSVASIGGNGSYSQNVVFTADGALKTVSTDSAPRWFAGLCKKLQIANGIVDVVGLTRITDISGNVHFEMKDKDGKIIKSLTSDEVTCISKSQYDTDSFRQFNDWLDTFLEAR